jgi:ATP-dependent RNA helicase SUPV3L1/SUV3
LTVRLPDRRAEPETVIAHLGPTNSGKTHDALRFLVEHGNGVYTAPLRMLAQAAARRLATAIGDVAQPPPAEAGRLVAEMATPARPMSAPMPTNRRIEYGRGLA